MTFPYNVAPTRPRLQQMASRARCIRVAFLFPLLALVLSNCGPSPNPLSLQEFDSYTLASAPQVNSFSYSIGATQFEELAPFVISRLIYPDLETGSCSASTNSAEIVLRGTFDSVRTAELQLSGALSSSVTTSGTNFSITACVPAGATLLRLQAVNSENRPNAGNVTLSLVIRPRLKTLAEALPSYPSPGFKTGGASTSLTSLNSNGLMARSFAVDSIGQDQITSLGAPGLTLSLGFSHLVALENP